MSLWDDPSSKWSAQSSVRRQFHRAFLIPHRGQCGLPFSPLAKQHRAWLTSRSRGGGTFTGYPHLCGSEAGVTSWQTVQRRVHTRICGFKSRRRDRVTGTVFSGHLSPQFRSTTLSGAARPGILQLSSTASDDSLAGFPPRFFSSSTRRCDSPAWSSIFAAVKTGFLRSNTTN